MFRDFFSSGFGGGQPGGVQILQVPVSLEELFMGRDKTVEYTRTVCCDACDGMGGAGTRCGTCNGSGMQVSKQQAVGRVVIMQGPCSTCAGEGWKRTSTCSRCRGTGARTQRESIVVTVPRGGRK
jgi:molecular chaperone DnaJ